MSSRLEQRIRRRTAEDSTAISPPVDWSRMVTVDGTSISSTDLLEDARRAGYDAGYQAATQEMLAAEAAGRSAQMRRIADTLVASAGEVSRARREAITMGVAEAVELAYQLTEAFLQRELAAGPTATDAVARAMRLVPEGHDLIVRLHPGDPVEVDELKAMVPDVEVKVVADPHVESGGCVVTAGSCRVDTQLTAALARARDVLAEMCPDARFSGENASPSVEGEADPGDVDPGDVDSGEAA